MTFLNPWMLAGAATAAIPIALHFFYRAHYKPLPWAAMKFLRLAIEQTSRRLRFQELVLLILRILVCVILALALARPAAESLSVSGGRGESVDAVIIMDTSFSMEAPVTDTATRLDRAKEAALKVIDNLPPSSTVQIISCASGATNLGPRSPSNLDQARYIVKNLKTGSLSTDYLAGFTAAVEAFSTTTGGSREVYLIGDMQRAGWEKQSSAVRSKADEIRNQASLYLVRVGEDKIANVAIVGILPQTEIPHVNSQVAFTVLLRNSGTVPVENLNVSLNVEGQEKFQNDSAAVARVDPGETKAVTIAGKFDKSGWKLLTARINDDSDDTKSRRNRDDLAQDNTFRLMLRVHEKIRVLVVDGSYNAAEPSKSGSFYLANALLPIPADARDEYHVKATVVRPENTGDDTLAEQDICFLANVAVEQLDPRFVTKLDEHVRSGKGLFISSGTNVIPAEYNRLLGKLLPAPLVEGPAFRTPEDVLAQPSLTSVDRYSFLSQMLDKDDHPLRTLAAGLTARITAVADPRDATGKGDLGRVLMRFDNDMPLLLSRSVGIGEVMFLTTSADVTWSVLCTVPAFPPFINGCVSHMNMRNATTYNRTAGEVIRWTPQDNSREYYVEPPEGERVFLGKPKEGDDRLPPFDTTNAGVYRITPSGGSEELTDRLIFNPDLAESENLDNLTDEQIDNVLDFKPVHLETGWDGSTFTGTERSRKEWTIWVLVALLFFALGETLFAWYCGRSW